jgi:hypothetical protein
MYIVEGSQMGFKRKHGFEIRLYEPLVFDV